MGFGHFLQFYPKTDLKRKWHHRNSKQEELYAEKSGAIVKIHFFLNYYCRVGNFFTTTLKDTVGLLNTVLIAGEFFCFILEGVNPKKDNEE